MKESQEVFVNNFVEIEIDKWKLFYAQRNKIHLEDYCSEISVMHCAVLLTCVHFNVARLSNKEKGIYYLLYNFCYNQDR